MSDPHYHYMLEELANTKPHPERLRREDESRKYSHIPGDMFIVAPPVYFTDYYQELKAKGYPDYRMLIGKVVDDGLPLSINMNNPIRGRVLHLMSDSCLRLKDFVFAIAHGIDAQYKPFADPNPAASTDTPLLSYAVVNHWPLDWEWMDEQKAHKGRIPLISALKENGSVVQDFMEKMIAEWRSKKQTGLFFLPELAELISIPKGTQLVRYIDSLLNTPDKDVRFIVTSRYTDYTPTPHITPVISIENDWLSPFFSRDGQWKYKDGNLWRTFDILRPKLTNVQAETGK